MIKVILLVLSSLEVFALSIGATAGKYTEPVAGVYAQSNLYGNIYTRLEFTREFDSKEIIKSKINKSRGCNVKPIVCPKQEAKPVPKQEDKPSVKKYNTKLSTVSKNIDRLDFILGADVYEINSVKVSTYTGIGYSFTDNKYENNLYIPIGVGVSYDITSDINFNVSYEKVFNSNFDSSKDSIKLRLGYKI